MSTLRWAYVWGFLVFVAGSFVYFPALQVLSLRWITPYRTSFMVLREGDVHQKTVPLRRISSYLQNAVIASEDATFYEHHGVDFKEMEKTIERNMKKGKYARGGSTITMQLARNIFLTPKKMIWRKAAELILTFEMEQMLSKDRILEIYLNVAEWGPGVYGAQAASQYYFKKNASALSPNEAVFLASILPSPRKWGRLPPGPYVERRMGIIRSRAGF